mgnify:FL=1
MITPLTEKLRLTGHDSPHWQVAGDKFYSKFEAIKKCRAIGHEWPSYHVWSKSQAFARPKSTFLQSVDAQCEIISDAYKKVRLFYSGGRDSHLILHRMLKNNYKLDEIAIYRRFPGVIDKDTNEFDQYKLGSVLRKTLDEYDSKIPVKFYDLLPEHFHYYSTRLETLYFPYTNLEFFGHGVHPLAEWFPGLLDGGWVNILGNGRPDVVDNSFHWIDTSLNLTHNDPYTLQFFLDERNTDLAVNLAYTIHDLSKKHTEDQHMNNDALGVKDFLQYPNTGTLLDSKWDSVDTSTNVSRWFIGPKEIFYATNALRSEVGRETYSNMIRFYEETESNYKSYFDDGSIYNAWIGGVSETHTLVDV